MVTQSTSQRMTRIDSQCRTKHKSAVRVKIETLAIHGPKEMSNPLRALGLALSFSGTEWVSSESPCYSQWVKPKSSWQADRAPPVSVVESFRYKGLGRLECQEEVTG